MRISIGILPAVLALTACGQRPFDTGTTPVIAAVRDGRPGAIRALITAGADPNLPAGVNGWPPLMHAVHKDRKLAVAALLDSGADPNQRSADGSTALIMAAGYGATGMVRLLLEHGADPRIENFAGISALTMAVSGVADIDNFTLGSCQSETVKALLDAAPDLKVSANVWGRIALTIGCAESLKALDRPGQARTWRRP
jgi:ankyrin repeat protein